MAAETLLLKAIDYTLKFLQLREERDAQEQQKVDDVLESFREALIITRAYLADCRNGVSERDRAKEVELSKAWNEVGLKVRNIGTPDAEELYQIFFEKADYWSDPESWQRNTDGEIDISLSRVEQEIDKLLKKENA